MKELSISTIEELSICECVLHYGEVCVCLCVCMCMCMCMCCWSHHSYGQEVSALSSLVSELFEVRLGPPPSLRHATIASSKCAILENMIRLIGIWASFSSVGILSPLSPVFKIEYSITMCLVL